MKAAVLAVAACGALAACDDTTPAWELDNDRIIAVRATPPGLAAGERAVLDALITLPDQGPGEVEPAFAAAAPARPDEDVPPALAAAVVQDGGDWTVVAPDEATLAQLRADLGIMPGQPVPLRVGVAIAFPAGQLLAIKTVWLGEAAANPELGAVTVNGAPAADGMTVPPDVDVALAATAAETDAVAWLTSVGDLSDADDAVATLHHDTTADPPPPTTGHLAVVKRSELGGVAWGFWAIAVAP
jgi:hypothetical protein